jgi:hypothetical protein
VYDILIQNFKKVLYIGSDVSCAEDSQTLSAVYSNQLRTRSNPHYFYLADLKYKVNNTVQYSTVRDVPSGRAKNI